MRTSFRQILLHTALKILACGSTPADFCLVCNKIMLENPHTFLMKTGSKSCSFRLFPFLVLIHKVVGFFYENVHSIGFGRNGFVYADASADFIRLAR